MAKPAVAGEVHQPLDVHCRFATKIALDRMVLVDRLAKCRNLLVGEVLDALLGPIPSCSVIFLAVVRPIP
jgi:hypothetical protein